MTGKRPLSCVFLALIISGQCSAQDIPTPGHKCVYNCDAPTAPSDTSGYGAAIGSALGAAIVRSIANRQQQREAPVPDNGQSAAAQRALDDWANGGPTKIRYPAGSASASANQSAASELDRWANEVQNEDLRDAPNSNPSPKHRSKPAQNGQAPVQVSTQAAVAPAPATVPEECVESGQVTNEHGLTGRMFYQCWPGHGQPKYCLQTSPAGSLEAVPCNTVTK